MNINKACFVITDWTTWEHLKNVIRALPENAFDIVIANERQKAHCLRIVIRNFVRRFVGFTNGKVVESSKLRPEDFENI